LIFKKSIGLFLLSLEEVVVVGEEVVTNNLLYIIEMEVLMILF
jgi:hypothetical protein